VQRVHFNIHARLSLRNSSIDEDTISSQILAILIDAPRNSQVRVDNHKLLFEARHSMMRNGPDGICTHILVSLVVSSQGTMLLHIPMLRNTIE
jgi:hypothetical protein